MNKEKYLLEIEKRLSRYFSALRSGYKASDAERHRLEGFIQAAIFMELATGEDVSVLMERVHYSIFGKTIEERKLVNAARWREAQIDYTGYDRPAYERRNR